MSRSSQQANLKLDYGQTPRSRRAWLIPVATMALTLGYLIFPFAAGTAGVVGRPAPFGFTRAHWNVLYITGWEMAGRPGKPREAVTLPRRQLVPVQ